VLLICGGVVSLAFVARRKSLAAGKSATTATLWALGGALVVATYTLIDATGVRSSGGTERYVVWLFVFIGLPFVSRCSQPGALRFFAMPRSTGGAASPAP
jgi:hypothetical protein